MLNLYFCCYCKRSFLIHYTLTRFCLCLRRLCNMLACSHCAKPPCWILLFIKTFSLIYWFLLSFDFSVEFYQTLQVWEVPLFFHGLICFSLLKYQLFLVFSCEFLFIPQTQLMFPICQTFLDCYTGFSSYELQLYHPHMCTRRVIKLYSNFACIYQSFWG